MNKSRFVTISIVIFIVVHALFCISCAKAETQTQSEAEELLESNSNGQNNNEKEPVSTNNEDNSGTIPEIEMVFVEGGNFNFHNMDVNVEDFYITKYEITEEIRYLVESWALETGIYSSKLFYTVPLIIRDDWNNSHDPIFCSFIMAILFCNALSISQNFTPIYYIDENFQVPVNMINMNYGSLEKFNFYINNTANGYRLATEVEWEYAARGGKYSKGYECSGSDNPDEVAWYKNYYPEYRKFYPVGTKKSNELGLYDMSGNVAELCIDNWNENPLTDEQLRNGKYLYQGKDTDSTVLKGGYNFDPNKHITEEQTIDIEYLNSEERQQMLLERNYSDFGKLPSSGGLRLIQKKG